MKFTIEVEEFWLEEEGAIELEKELKYSIIQQTVKTIKDSIKEQVATQIELKVREVITQEVTATIHEEITNFLASGVVKGRYSSDPKIPFAKAVENAFTYSNIMSNLENFLRKVIEGHTTKLVSELRERCDTAFATQIVMKLNEQNFLKEGIIDLLTQK